MPFGLHSAGATFQRYLDGIIGADLSPYAFTYLDDIIVTGRTLAENLTILLEIFQRLRENRLKINKEKSKFLQEEVVYLGHVVNKDGIHTDPEKVSAITKIPVPRNVKELRRFIGMISWYRRFIVNCSEITRPLTKLTGKKQAWQWGDEQQAAFEELKKRLISAPILVPPDFSKTFTLQTDASNEGLGVVLTQTYDDTEHVIAYASRTLNKTEQNYSTTEKECLAVVWGIQKMRPYLEGYSFIVITDHQSLRWLQKIESPAGRIARWSVYLQQFDFSIQYRKGTLNKIADALSRNPNDDSDDECNKEELFAIDVANDCPWYNRLLHDVTENPDRHPEYCIKNPCKNE